MSDAVTKVFMASTLTAGIVALVAPKIALYTNSPSPNPLSVYADFTEPATLGGAYVAGGQVAVPFAVHDNADQSITVQFGSLAWTWSVGSEVINGYFLHDTGSLISAHAFASPVVMADLLDSCIVNNAQITIPAVNAS